MKNPWMSLWLSAANTAAATARGFWMAEAERQRKVMAKQMAQVMFPLATPTRKRGPKEGRSK